MNEKDILNILYTNKHEAFSFAQNPINWLNLHGLTIFAEEIKHLDPGSSKKNRNKENYQKIKQLIHDKVFGKKLCEICGNIVEDTIKVCYKRGFKKTCSEKCYFKLISKAKKGKDTLSPEARKQSKIAQSITMKRLILEGKFTPKCENYYNKTGMIEFVYNKNVRKVRSLWELIFWIINPTFLYENIRLEYYDTNTNSMRIYITDFYDGNNTIYEVKPIKYQYTLKDKQKAVIDAGYNFIIIDDNHMKKYNTEEMKILIKNYVINKPGIENRLKWLKAK
jgi:hypothetical protein